MTGKRADNERVRVPDQRSLTDQLSDLHRLAIEHGLYDAADWMAKWWAADEGVTT